VRWLIAVALLAALCGFAHDTTPVEGEAPSEPSHGGAGRVGPGLGRSLALHRDGLSGNACQPLDTHVAVAPCDSRRTENQYRSPRVAPARERIEELVCVSQQSQERESDDLAAVRARYRPSDVALLDRHGEVIHELRLDHSRRRLGWTPLADISPALVRAAVESEDRRFFSHDGVDWKAVAAAIVQRLRGGAPRGASTITMQLATLLDPSLRRGDEPRSVRQKWAQMRAAWGIERRWSKNEILEAYLNLLTFRGELQGVAAATNVLFGKVPHGITTAEGLVLAVLPRAPNADREAVVARAWNLRDRTEKLPRADIERAVVRALDAPAGGGPRASLAPHVAHRLLSPDGDLTPVRSTLDADVQRMAQEALRRQLVALRARRVQDGAVLVVENATGAVLGYVGGGNDLSSARFVDGVRMRRQAGSVLKPFLYGLALEQHLLTPASLIEDTPLELPVVGGLYRPQNYDEQFRGAVSLRTALSSSLNIPAVRTLGLVGAEPYVAHLRRLGFAGLSHSGDYYGPSLALGSADVSLWELVGAYRTLANGGVQSEMQLVPSPPAYQEVVNRRERAPRYAPLRYARSASYSGQASGGYSGRAAFDFPSSPSSAERREGRIEGLASSTGSQGAGRDEVAARIYSPATAFLIGDILADRESRSVTFGLENPLATRFWTAVKTGTSKEMRDNWCVGFSRDYTVGVWVGNFSGEPMRDVSGVSGAAPLWLDIMEWLHRNAPSQAPPPPAGVDPQPIVFPASSEPARAEWFARGTEPPFREQARARRRPRVLSPVGGAIIAIDPDIPPPLQRVLFAAAGASGAFRWALDGRLIGAADHYLWEPRPGAHTLALVDDREQIVDRVRFTVRGR